MGRRAVPWSAVAQSLLAVFMIVGGLGYFAWEGGRHRAPAILVLANVRFEPVAGTDRSVVASGDVVNAGTVDAMPGGLRVIFRDQDRRTLGEKVYALKRERLAPGERQAFRHRIDYLPPGTVMVDVTAEVSR
jgi:hypothetical protein